MTKIIETELEKCKHCPNLETIFKENGYNKYTCIEAHWHPIENPFNPIPDWCPLPDKNRED